jgi:hypothetical protein
MNHSYASGDPNDPPRVLHRPFASLMPKNVKADTACDHVIFIVVYAQGSYLPPAVT